MPLPAREASSSGRPNKRLVFAAVEGKREWFRLMNAIARGAGAGFCLRGGIHVLSWLFALVVRSRRKRLMHKPLQTVSDQIFDTVRYTAFLASLAGVYVGADEGIANLLGRKRTAGWRSFVSGLLAGPTILLTGPNTRHHSLAIYILLRGLTLLVRCGNKKDAPSFIRRLLAPTRWQHGDTALMCLSTSQLGYSWLMCPSTLPPSYVHFLNHHGGKQLFHYKAVRELAENNANGLRPRLLQHLQGTRHAQFCGKIPCEFVHTGHACFPNLFYFLPQAYLRALPVYAPVYILPAILVHRQKLIHTGAFNIWSKIGIGTLRSSLFLASYCTLAWGGACGGFNATSNCTPSQIFLTCWSGGLATLVEKKSRRMELALYCASRALESWALCLVEWGFVRPNTLPTRLDVLIFSVAVAAILHCYSDHHGQHRDVFRSKYLNVLDFILGNKGLDRGAIQHVPSTTDLLTAQGLGPDQLRHRASQFASSVHAQKEEYEASASPRSDVSGAFITRFHSSHPERLSIDE